MTMKNKISYPFSVLVSLAGSAFAANSLTYDFNSSVANDKFEGGGVAGWSQDTPNPSAFGNPFPLAYVAATNFQNGEGLSNSAHLGTQRANTSNNADTTLTGDLSSLDPIYNMMNVSFNMAILDDNTDSYEGRDNFNVALTDASGAQAATIGLSPNAGSNEKWDVSVGVNGSTSTTGYTISAQSSYNFYIESRDNLTSFSYGAGDGSGLRIGLGSFNEKVTSLNSITGIAFEHDPLSPVGTSAHTLAFDNISVQIPEPSSSLLMVLSAGLIAIRRRR
jgi:hypothetical protein